MSNLSVEGKVEANRLNEMVQIDLNIDENVKHFESGRHGIDGD